MRPMQNNSGQPNPLGTLPIPTLLVKYAVPSVISMLVMSLYNIVDQVFIGNSSAGYLGNGATTVVFPVVTVVLALSLLIGNGSAAFINIEMGKGNPDIARSVTGNAVTLILGVGVAGALIGAIFLQPLLVALGATPDVFPYAVDYGAVIILGTPFAMGSTAMSHIIRSDGSPRYSMMATLSGAVLNTVLDPFFIFDWGLGWGVRGAAVATVLSQMVSFFISLYYIMYKARYTRLSGKHMRLDTAIVRRVAAYGSSSFMTQSANTLVNVVLNKSLVYYGALSAYGPEIPLSALGIVMKINAILLSTVVGVNIGAQPILGYNYGARNYVRVRKTYFTQISITFTLSALFNLLFVTNPNIVIRLFGDESPEFTSFAAMALRIFLCCVWAAGLQIPSANYFQSVGKPLKAMTLTMSRQVFLLVPAILVFPLFWGLEGILYTAPFADVTALLITSIFIVREMRSLSTASQLPAEPAAGHQ